jgi:hypothetical protein
MRRYGGSYRGGGISLAPVLKPVTKSARALCRHTSTVLVCEDQGIYVILAQDQNELLCPSEAPLRLARLTHKSATG